MCFPFCLVRLVDLCLVPLVVVVVVAVIVMVVVVVVMEVAAVVVVVVALSFLRAKGSGMDEAGVGRGMNTPK